MSVLDQNNGYSDPDFFKLMDTYITSMLLVKHFDETLEHLYSPVMQRARNVAEKQYKEDEKALQDYVNKLFEQAYRS